MKEFVRDYFRFFKWIFIPILVLAVLLFTVKGVRSIGNGNGERQNMKAPAQRVYDYGNVLTDDEEQALEDLIAQTQVQANCDIVLVTLNESLKEYARAIEPNVPYDEFVRVYAEQFYEENDFGYDRPNGTGVILVDNWYREEDGWVYTWLATTGKAHEMYSASDIDHSLDRVYKYIENNPYKAYSTYVNDVIRYMDKSAITFSEVPVWAPLIAGIIAAVIFFSLNWKSRSGSKTTTATTYINGGQAQFVDRRDIFIRKTVTKRRIETNSSSGGHSGGGHSGGGGGHGGGGHRR